jgi:hypothetical protein
MTCMPLGRLVHIRFVSGCGLGSWLLLERGGRFILEKGAGAGCFDEGRELGCPALLSYSSLRSRISRRSY